mmetsp:Transcript_6030/g.9608  ORF Transcript_6030/g.9608 Transcript_6030/m.9608 type:complete len:137 (-) Transcript_6030:890-1300(-)
MSEEKGEQKHHHQTKMGEHSHDPSLHYSEENRIKAELTRTGTVGRTPSNESNVAEGSGWRIKGQKASFGEMVNEAEYLMGPFWRCIDFVVPLWFEEKFFGFKRTPRGGDDITSEKDMERLAHQNMAASPSPLNPQP